MLLSIVTSLAGSLAAAIMPTPNPTPTPDQTASPVAGPTASAPDAGRRYCIIVPKVTGTLIDRRECKTRARWLAEGVDPLAMK